MADSKGLEDPPEGKLSQYALALAGDSLSSASTDTHVFLGQIESNYDETTDSFDAMNLKSDLLRGMLMLARG